MEPKTKVTWKTAENKLQTLIYKGATLHSAYDPVKEAERMVKSIAQSSPEKVVILGMGLGYHVASLKCNLPGTEIFVYEPFEEIYRAALDYNYENWKEDKGINLYTDLDSLEDAIIQKCIYNGMSSFPILWLYPPYRKLAPDRVSDLKRMIERLKIRYESNRKTKTEKTGLWLDNIEKNWNRILEMPNLCSLHMALEGIPCVVIASGPSLANDYPLLNRLKGRSLLFSADSAYSWLEERGVSPDVVAVLEGEDMSYLLKGKKNGNGTWMSLSTSTHPGHFHIKERKNILFHSERWLARLLDQEPFVPHGGNVASASFTMALIMGCNPIILVGQDLSHGTYALHAGGIKGAGEEKAAKQRRFPMEGRKGYVYGHSAMVSYLSWYEESARYLSLIRPDLVLINATSSGANIRGFREMPLEQAARRFCRKNADVHGLIRKHILPNNLNPEVVKDRLIRLKRNLGAIDRGLDSGSLQETLAREICSWVLGGNISPEGISKLGGFVDRLIEKT